MKGARAAGRSSGRSRRRPRSRGRVQRQPEEVGRTDAERLADTGWVEWGGELIWAVGFTLGGAPYGLRTSDFDPDDLEAMGLDPALAMGEDPGPGRWRDEADSRASRTSSEEGEL